MRSLIALTLVLACQSGPSWGAATAEEQAACRPDVRRFCGKIEGADERKYRDCLQSHVSDLSQKRQQVLLSHQNK